MATSDKVKLRYVKEVTKGTTPTTPVFKELRFTGESVNHAITTITSKEIRPDRSQADLVNTNADVTGSINAELIFASYDDFLESALTGTWTTNVLKDGVGAIDFYSIQKDIVDASPETFFNYMGCVIDGFSLNLQTGQILTATFDIRGMSAAVTEAQFSGATFTAANTNTPFNATSDVDTVTFDGVAFTGCINSMTVSYKNNTRPQDCVGTFGHTDIKYGKKELTGSLNMYFTEKSHYDNFLNSTAFSISYELTDVAGNKYTILLPRVKYESATIAAEGENSDIMFNATYRALFDSIEGCMIKITRAPA